MFAPAARSVFARLLRMTAMAVLLLAVLGNPVLAAVGDTYEAARGASGHLHDVLPHGDNGKQAGAQADRSDGADLLHALAHATHCCGHLSAVLPGLLPALAFVGSSEVPSASLLAPSPARPATLIRPPIRV